MYVTYPIILRPSTLLINLTMNLQYPSSNS